MADEVGFEPTEERCTPLSRLPTECHKPLDHSSNDILVQTLYRNLKSVNFYGIITDESFEVEFLIS